MGKKLIFFSFAPSEKLTHAIWFFVILKCHHLSESYLTVLCCGSSCYGVDACCKGVVLTFDSVDLKSLTVASHMKATKPYFHVVLFIPLYRVLLGFHSVGEILSCDHSNESFFRRILQRCGLFFSILQKGILEFRIWILIGDKG